MCFIFLYHLKTRHRQNDIVIRKWYDMFHFVLYIVILEAKGEAEKILVIWYWIQWIYGHKGRYYIACKWAGYGHIMSITMSHYVYNKGVRDNAHYECIDSTNKYTFVQFHIEYIITLYWLYRSWLWKEKA